MDNSIGFLIYDSAMDRNIPTKYSNISKEDREKEIRKLYFTALGLDMEKDVDPRTGMVYKKAMRRAYRENKNKVFSIIEDVLDQTLLDGEYAKDQFFMNFVDLKNLALGDENIFSIRGRKKLNVSEFSGNHFNINRERYDAGTNFSVKMRNFGISVYEYASRIASGRVSFTDLVTDMQDAINRFLADYAKQTFAVAVQKLPSELNISGSYNEEQILQAAQRVQASCGTKPYALGTAVALRKLQGINTNANIWYSDAMKDEKNNLSYITVWNGIKCIELEQGLVEGSLDFTMDDDVVYLLGGDEKPVKMCLEGETEVMDISDTWNGANNADKSVEQVLTFKAGASVVYNKLFAKIDLA